MSDTTVTPSPAPKQPVPTALCTPMTQEREDEMRRAVVAEALKWVGTPYYNLGDTLGAGVDCCMLLIRAWVDSGLIEPFDPRPYPVQWYMHSDEERYLEWLQLCAVEVDEPKMGDIVVWKFGRCFSHSAILVDPHQVVHALAEHRRCLVTSIDESFLRWVDRSETKTRPVRYFDIFARIREVVGG